jgi:tripartite-type tricarboxylate transporter receptor subunit TctC
MKRRVGLGLSAAVLGAVVAALTAAPAQAKYPDRPLTIIVPWGAGGGTDATGRIIASLLEKWWATRRSPARRRTATRWAP